MKLISCYIENFGKISQTEFEFGEGLTEFIKPNGEGKTTLADFIKAMFYGLPSYRKNSAVFDGRQRYCPFGGGRFGGSLTFSSGGEVYRIERFFDKKSGARDEFTFYKGVEKTDGASGDIGKKVFGIDESAFERTVFFGADGSGENEKNSGGFGAKLNAEVLAESAENYEAAVRVLDEKMKELKAARGNGGILNGKREEKIKVREEIAELEATEGKTAELYRESERLSAEISELEKRLVLVNEDRILKERRNLKNKFVAETDAKREKAQNILNKYPRGIPSVGEISAAEADYLRYVKNGNLLSDKTVSADKEFASVEKVFASADKEKLEYISGEIEKFDGKKAESENKRGNNSSAVIAALAAVSAGMIAVGAALMFYIIYAGAALSAVGAAGIVSALCVWLTRRSKTRGGKSDDGEKLRFALSELGYSTGNIIADMTAYASDLKIYSSLLSARESNAADLLILKEENARLSEKLSDFFAKYGLAVPEDIAGAFGQMKFDAQIYGNLISEIEAAEKTAEEFGGDSISECAGDEREIAEELSQKRRALGVADSRISFYESETERLPEKRNAAEALDREIEELKERYFVISSAKQLLEKAVSRLNEKYISPVKERFLHYMNVAEAETDGKITMDASYRVLLEKNGELRSGLHMSAGQRSICGLCLRLALIDNMYEIEKPFLVLDDPFVSLDSENMRGAAKAVSSLSKEMQIIYFTCHDSRKINK